MTATDGKRATAGTVFCTISPRYAYAERMTEGDELFAELDGGGFEALELWGADDFDVCLGKYHRDPWERLRYIRESIGKTRLMLTLRGQCLLGYRMFPDDVTEYFISRARYNGVDIFRVYDALNDPRNIEASAAAVKHFGGELHAAMVYDGGSVQGASFFAGYAACLEQMGADRIWLLDPNGLLTSDTAGELTGAVKAAVSLPLMLSTRADVGTVKAALAAGACGFEYCAGRSDAADTLLSNNSRNAVTHYLNACATHAAEGSLSDDIFAEMRRIQAETGYPALISPISEIVEAQAYINLKEGRYADILPEISALLRGMYGRTPSPVPDAFLHDMIGDAPILLERPADKLERELCALRSDVAPYMEDVEDILTYAMAGEDAIDFFELRKARKYHLDASRSDPSLGVHVI